MAVSGDETVHWIAVKISSTRPHLIASSPSSGHFIDAELKRFDAATGPRVVAQLQPPLGDQHRHLPECCRRDPDTAHRENALINAESAPASPKLSLVLQQPDERVRVQHQAHSFMCLPLDIKSVRPRSPKDGDRALHRPDDRLFGFSTNRDDLRDRLAVLGHNDRVRGFRRPRQARRETSLCTRKLSWFLSW